MDYMLRLSDDQNRHLAVLTLDESTASHLAADVVFDIIGINPEELVESGRLAAGQVEDLRSLQKTIFDRDSEGLFIRDTIHFKANGRELDPDSPISRAFVVSERESIKYMRCDLMAIDKAYRLDNASSALQSSPNLTEALETGMTLKDPAQTQYEKSTGDHIEDFSRVMFLHQIAIGTLIDVTKDYPELLDVIAYSERENLIEIDVKKAAYKLTEKGKRRHDSYIAEAQDLIKRFDIYVDVDIDSSGSAHFDTGLGRDLRVAAFEMEGADPFRARFLLGLNDGEWDKLNNWSEVFRDESWYREIFSPVERAPGIEEIGRDKLTRVMDQAKAILREQRNSGL